MLQPQYRRSGRHWYVSDGLIWDDLPAQHRAAAVAKANVLFCAQAVVRVLTRGLPHTRAMYSVMGVPIKLRPQ